MIDARHQKLLNIARDRRKTLEKEKKQHENWEKYQTKLINTFLLLLFHIEKVTFC